MPVSLQQLSFTAGEWSPSLDPRFDLAKYRTAVKTMRNFYPLAHGGANNRPGTDYVVRLKDVSKVGRLVPFQFSVVQSYVLVFEDLLIRFVRDGGIITEATQAITAITQANPAVLTYSGADTYANGDRVLITGVVGMIQVNNREFTVANVNVGANTFELSGTDSTAFTAYASGGTVAEIVQLVTTYLEADLGLLKFEQSADTMYITHPSYSPRKLTRTSHTSWTLTTIAFGASVATPVGLAMAGVGRFFAVTAIDANQNESVPSVSEEGAPSNTLTWTAVVGAVEYKIYEVLNATYQFITRTATNSWAAPATITPDVDLAAPTAQTIFSGADNFPGCSAFFEQRLYMARTNNKPQSFFGSVIGDFENHNTSSPLKDDDALSFTINSNQVNEIRWMSPLNDLIIGTSGAEYKLSAGGGSASITPTSIQLKPQSAWGVAHIQPIKIGSSLVFVDGSKRRVRDLLFSFTIDGYEGSDLTILAQHLFEQDQIKEWSYARQPDSILWAVRDDGVVCGLTYNKEHQVFGWHRHDTDGTFESVTSVQTSEGTNEVYFIVKRTVNGATVRYVERLHTRDYTDVEDAFFVDSGLTFLGSVSATLTPGAGATVVGTLNVVFTAGSSVFVSGDVGRFIHFRYATGLNDANGTPLYLTARAEITTFTSGTSVSGTIISRWPNLNLIASGAWRMSVTSISGLFHLAGKTVVALADGNVVTNISVSSVGVITLPTAASKVHLGLAYTCDLHTLGFEYSDREGTNLDKERDITTVVVYLRNSRELFVGPDANHLIEAKIRTTEDYGDPTRLFTGPKEVSIPPGTLNDARIFVRVKNPVPITVGAVIPRLGSGRL